MKSFLFSSDLAAVDEVAALWVLAGNFVQLALAQCGEVDSRAVAALVRSPPALRARLGSHACESPPWGRMPPHRVPP